MEAMEQMKEELEAAAHQAIATLQAGAEEAMKTAVTALRDKCNEFLGEGEAPPEATQLPAEPTGE